ncbi:H(+)/Cl(-) exchange transporter 7 [Hyposmocoma kahamanoa]|uniref:H(+)/Cl(-) exchange transporter 7 n=1 Tax=Hyposmocoma kahamanoa TaxID=1477025 RepID=UPI000E6D6521|nr:H(+)/Cl(-) exchange transporter 7 [Hyposmocoma kahamanoa]
MSNSSNNVEENISVTTSDTAQLISNDEAGTSNDTRLNKEVNFQDSDEEDVQGSHGIRRRQPVQKIEPGSLNILSAKYESLDYDTCENHLLLDEERKRGFAFVLRKDIARWFIMLLIGMITALIAFIIDIAIEEFSNIKYKLLKKSVDKYVLIDKLYIPYLLWVLSNIAIVFIGSVLVAYVEPVAGGSGIPQVKCYLNGVKIPRVVRIKTLIVKTIGVITAVVGGLAGGKEGPMIHSGAVVAAGISQGKSTTFNKDFKVFQYFREDHEKRDFVSGGAAAGVSAAFGAPIGGVLFSLEEGTSFWNQALTWRIFFGTVVSTFTLNFALSTYHGHPGELSYPGLLNLGKMEPFPFQVYELPVFMIFGAIGGIMGALWNHINYKLAVFRTISVEKYALIGAAAQLGGVVRMTISLTVIIIETTGQISNALPIITTLIVAKWIGDFFNEGIYDTYIQLAAVPILPWEPPPLTHNIYASEVMSHPVFTLRTVENVGHIVEILKVTTYNGFPIVDPPATDDAEVTTYKRLRGLILRSQLIVLLQKKLYNENANTTWSNIKVDMNMFREGYPRYPSIDQLQILDWEKTCMIDLRPFMNPSPYTLPHRASLPRLFRLFRALGLRHLPIVNDVNEVVGMVTRKDIARYRVWRHRGHMGMEELLLSSEI